LSALSVAPSGCSRSSRIEAAPARVALRVCDGAAGQAAMKTTLIIEIRAAEGGDDAKLLVHEQFAVYQKLAVRERL
jgi:protein subunit release factor A